MVSFWILATKANMLSCCVWFVPSGNVTGAASAPCPHPLRMCCSYGTLFSAYAALSVISWFGLMTPSMLPWYVESGALVAEYL